MHVEHLAPLALKATIDEVQAAHFIAFFEPLIRNIGMHLVDHADTFVAHCYGTLLWSVLGH